MELYLPSSAGEWLAWSSAVVMAFLGAVMLLAPGLAMRFLRLQPAHGRVEAYASIRASMAGPYLGLGLGCLIFAQPFLWVVLGAAWSFALFGRFISMTSDKGVTFQNALAAIIEFALAAGTLFYAFGFIV